MTQILVTVICSAFIIVRVAKKVKGIPLARMTIGILASIALEHQYIREWLLGTNI